MRILKKSKKYGRTIALIDAANIIYANKYLKWPLDHKKLIDYLKTRYNCQEAVYYTGFEKGDRIRTNFYKKIRTFGFKVKTKEVVVFRGKFYWKHFNCPHCGQRIHKRFQGPPIKKANCDVDLTLDAKNKVKNYDTLLLFSGDGDFSDLVLDLKNRYGKKTLVFSSKKSCARRLRQVAKAFIELHQLRSILEVK